MTYFSHKKGSRQNALGQIPYTNSKVSKQHAYNHKSNKTKKCCEMVIERP